MLKRFTTNKDQSITVEIYFKNNWHVVNTFASMSEVPKSYYL